MDQKIQADLESRLNEMGEENELLLLQLHQVQEALEHHHLLNKSPATDLAAAPEAGDAIGRGWVDDELPEALAEGRRLLALVDVQRYVHETETRNALNSKLGDLLIKGADSPGSIATLPGKLWKIWRSYSRQTPPESLGGKGFDKVIDAYGEGSFDAVDKLMSQKSSSPAMQANGYTALARYLMKGDRVRAAEEEIRILERKWIEAAER